MKFTKMHGLGNDFILVDNMALEVNFTQNMIEMLCKNHYGIGSDGFIAVEPSKDQDIKMRYYNHDGNEAEMCGNGMRCFSKYVFDKKILRKRDFTVETLAGNLKVSILESKETSSDIKVSMGKIRFDCKRIPVISDKKILLNEKYEFEGKNIFYGCASMGNPHMVIILEDIKGFSTEKAGPYFENHPMFPNKANVNFVRVINSDTVEILTWERGVGFTEACGTGTCASVGVLEKLGKVGTKVTALLPGGKLTIEIQEEEVFMTGRASCVFEGEIDPYNLERNGEI